MLIFQAHRQPVFLVGDGEAEAIAPAGVASLVAPQVWDRQRSAAVDYRAVSYHPGQRDIRGAVDVDAASRSRAVAEQLCREARDSRRLLKAPSPAHSVEQKALRTAQYVPPRLTRPVGEQNSAADDLETSGLADEPQSVLSRRQERAVRRPAERAVRELEQLNSQRCGRAPALKAADPDRALSAGDQSLSRRS